MKQTTPNDLAIHIVEIFARKCKSGYYLCDKNGNAVHRDGSLAYHPEFYDTLKKTGVPEWKEKE